MQSLQKPPVLQLQTEPFLRIIRYARCSLDLPLEFFNALSLLDAQEGSDSFKLLFRFQAVCHEWLCMEEEVEKMSQRLSLFGEQISIFCREEAEIIRALPAVTRCRSGVLSEEMRFQLFRMYKQAESQAKDSLYFQKKVDDLRRRMENDIQPQAAMFRRMLDAQPPLLIQSQWKKVEIPHCQFLKENPVVSALIQDLEKASSEEETVRIWDSLHQTAESLWNEVEEAFSQVGSFDEDLMQISADIRGWNSLCTAAGQYLQSMEQTLSVALDSKRLLQIQNQMEEAVVQWESMTRMCREFTEQIAMERKQENGGRDDVRK